MSVRICGRPLVSTCAGERRWMIFSTISWALDNTGTTSEGTQLIHLFLANCFLDMHQREGLGSQEPQGVENLCVEWRPGLMFHFQQLEAFPATRVTQTTRWGVHMVGRWMSLSIPGCLCFPVVLIAFQKWGVFFVCLFDFNSIVSAFQTLVSLFQCEQTGDVILINYQGHMAETPWKAASVRGDWHFLGLSYGKAGKLGKLLSLGSKTKNWWMDLMEYFTLHLKYRKKYSWIF